MEIIPLVQDDIFEKVVSALEAGDVVAIPTDTVYGLVADATNKEAVQKIFELKKRSPKKALSIFVSSIPMLEEYAQMPLEYYDGLSKLWPGPITAILKSRNILPTILHQTTPNIGVRIPNNVFLLEIIRRMGKPLVQTSANISGTLTLTTAVDIAHVFDMQNSLKYIIDAGEPIDTIQSIAVDFTAAPPRILRSGPFTKEELEEVFQTKFESAMNR
ncbi:MAG TPA: L-threonylcarbamoyladenylate synthase [Candidatus Paceibacterota bacterium]